MHRDVKPDNVLMDHRYTARIGDFGLTVHLEDGLDAIHNFTGTLGYLSPERACNEKHAFPADIWSLGMTVAYAAATVRGQEHGGFDPFQLVGKKQEVEAMKVAAAPDDEVHRVFPQPPSHRTALLPSEVNAEYHDEELLSFLAACLQISPQQRWTATQLLQHPFIRSVSSPASSTALCAAFGAPVGFDASSAGDLEHVCGILCDSYPLCTAGHAQASECQSECQLQLDEARLQCLAQQFGQSVEQVQQAFAKAAAAQRSLERVSQASGQWAKPEEPRGSSV